MSHFERGLHGFATLVRGILRHVGYESDRRTAQKQRTRQAIVDAARTLFLRDGAEAPSFDTICAEAGCTRGAFYVHFKDRESLVLAVMGVMVVDFVARLTESTGAATHIDAILAAFAGGLRDGRVEVVGTHAVQLQHIWAACTRYPGVRARYHAVVATSLAQVQSSLELQGVPDAAARATVLISAAVGAVALIQVGFPLNPDALECGARPLCEPSAPASAKRARTPASAKRTRTPAR